MSTHDLYKEIILDHYRNPRNSGKLKNPSITAEGANSLCGDELALTIALDDGKVSDVKVQARGCAICLASASMMTEAIKGQKLEKAVELGHIFKARMLDEQKKPLPAALQDLQVFEVAKKYRSRIKCTLLAWEALLEGIETQVSAPIIFS